MCHRNMEVRYKYRFMWQTAKYVKSAFGKSAFHDVYHMCLMFLITYIYVID